MRYHQWYSPIGHQCTFLQSPHLGGKNGKFLSLNELLIKVQLGLKDSFAAFSNLTVFKKLDWDGAVLTGQLPPPPPSPLCVKFHYVSCKGKAIMRQKKNQVSMHCDLDLLDPKSGEHILN